MEESSSSFCHNGIIPEREGLVIRDSRISLGRAVQDMEVIELINVSCCWEMNEDMSFEPRRLVRATLAGASCWKTLDGLEDFTVDALQHVVLCFTNYPQLTFIWHDWK